MLIVEEDQIDVVDVAGWGTAEAPAEAPAALPEAPAEPDVSLAAGTSEPASAGRECRPSPQCDRARRQRLGD